MYKQNEEKILKIYLKSKQLTNNRNKLINTINKDIQEINKLEINTHKKHTIKLILISTRNTIYNIEYNYKTLQLTRNNKTYKLDTTTTLTTQQLIYLYQKINEELITYLTNTINEQQQQLKKYI